MSEKQRKERIVLFADSRKGEKGGGGEDTSRQKFSQGGRGIFLERLVGGRIPLKKQQKYRKKERETHLKKKGGRKGGLVHLV